MNTDVLIIGGGPAGFACAKSAAHTYPEKKITIVRRDSVSVIPCGIPYVISSLEQVEHNILPDQGLVADDIEIVVDEVTGFDGKTAITASGKKISFEKLVLATGSRPTLPEIEGANLDGVMVIHKNFDFLSRMKEQVKNAENVFIVGGGFIGLEVADEILKLNKNVTICCRSRILRAAFDPEFCELAITEMENLGANVLSGTSIQKLEGSGSVSGVVLGDGTTVKSDLVIFGIGYDANVELAEKMGLELHNGLIKTDEYLRTSEDNVFAVGDCAIKREYFSRVPVSVMLASTAMAEGRLVGSNLYELNLIRGVKGTLGTFSTSFGKLSIGATGLTEVMAKKLGFNYIIGTAQAPDRHPGKIVDATMLKVKLLFSANSHTLLGAQVSGGKSVGEMINILSVMIQKGFTDTEIDTLQLGTHPLLTSSPIAYPIINATGNALIKSGWGRQREAAAMIKAMF
ncbi:MAG: FAD-dependent oxidoreductase [Spirochaetales bacterium]|uniref:FAD-dependent oxidoreductase n=1 Tax=Candidatus Thalassospirochaeta sargassi TaxID=3119039 RepID=A0AAJ1MJ23_9SPIO|nr:FAD-dependent oxidoreductase [Spirochaetales bacterium]